MKSSTVDLFKVLVAEKGELNFSNLKDGFITDFEPSREQVELLKSLFKPLPIVSLFSVEERKNSSPEQLIRKQVLHYFETYGLEMPGLFNLEVTQGKIVNIAFIKAVTVAELTDKVNSLLYTNRPIKDVSAVVDLILEYTITYDINAILNNELRIALFDPTHDTFESGDDVVRYICFKATEDPMLIKSKAVVKKVSTADINVDLLAKHVIPLAKVFNRHKRLIMACKRKDNATVINKISRLSKTLHEPIRESVSKHFIASAIKKEIKLDVLKKISLRDKFKYLNLIEYKMLGKDYDSFNIRNGKVWVEKDRKILDTNDLETLRSDVLRSIHDDISYLRGQNILLDGSVEYGLPISRKQSLGNLPYGTRVRATDTIKEFSAGIYWRNDWGTSAYHRIDLDLTAIDDQGNRTGWGQLSGYAENADIVYSGDMTDATDGATEFMVVSPARANRYGLMVNIFNTSPPVDAEIVVGYPSERDWQDKTIIRERCKLLSKQSVIGFFKNDTFVIYAGRLNESSVATGKHPIIDKGLGFLWTVTDVLNFFTIKYDTQPQEGVVYDHDLSYNNFTFDKLETLFKI